MKKIFARGLFTQDRNDINSGYTIRDCQQSTIMRSATGIDINYAMPLDLRNRNIGSSYLRSSAFIGVYLPLSAVKKGNNI
jgi:hypothetical protein